MAEITYWEKNFSGDLYNTNPTFKVGINNGDPLNTLDVIGSIGLTTFIELKKPGHDIIQLISASEFGYDFKILNVTDNRSLLHIDDLGNTSINTSTATARLTIMENRVGNAWPAASFTNISEVGFGVEVTGGNAGNNILTLKDYQDVLKGSLDGYGNWWVKGSVTTDNATSALGEPHYIMSNGSYRFAQLLVGEESGTGDDGSDLLWNRYGDDGTLFGTFLKVIRNTGDSFWYGNQTISGDLVVTGSLISGVDGRTLEDIKDPTSEEGKLLFVEGGVYEFKLPEEVFFPDLTNYYTKLEVDNLFDQADQELDAKIELYLTENPLTLQDVTNSNNVTSNVVESTAALAAPLLNLGTTSIETLSDRLTIHNDTHIDGILTFDSMSLKLHELADVAASVEFAPTNSVLRKISGEWVNVTLSDPDFSNYYNKQETDARYVTITGDTMIGTLIIDSPSDNLKLFSQEGIYPISVYEDTGINLKYGLKYSANSLNTEFDVDYYGLEKVGVGSVMHVDLAGTVFFGDTNKSLPNLGKIVIQSPTPTFILHDINTNVAFRVYNNNNTASLQVGTSLSFTNVKSPIVLTMSNAELYYDDSKKLETTTTGAEVFGILATEEVLLSNVRVYKDTDGTFVIDGPVASTSQYLENWTGPGTGTPPGASVLNDLNDVILGVNEVSELTFPFIIGRDTPTGGAAVPLSTADVVSMLDTVDNAVFISHVNDTDIHTTIAEKANWNSAFQYLSTVKDWDLSYVTYTPTEIGLADVNEEGTSIGNNPTLMKYLFYSDNGTKRTVKTRYADNAGQLGLKPFDEFRYSRALGQSLDNCDTILNRSLYDMGTTTTILTNVPEDGSWQVETVDASYLFNQNDTDDLKHKRQVATEWVDTEEYLNMWSRTYNGATQLWLPWVKFMHTGNTPEPLDFYPTLIQENYDMLQNPFNWVVTGTPSYEAYIGDVDFLNIGQRVVDNYYTYEATPLGVKRFTRGAAYLYDLFDVDFKNYTDEIDLNKNDVLVYQGDETWKPEAGFGVSEVTLVAAEGSITIDPLTDRLELTVEATGSADANVVIDHNREKPIVIDLNNLSAFDVHIMYSDDINPDTLLLTMQPDAIIEVHPGIWELN